MPCDCGLVLPVLSPPLCVFPLSVVRSSACVLLYCVCFLSEPYPLAVNLVICISSLFWGDFCPCLLLQFVACLFSLSGFSRHYWSLFFVQVLNLSWRSAFGSFELSRANGTTWHTDPAGTDRHPPSLLFSCLDLVGVPQDFFFFLEDSDFLRHLTHFLKREPEFGPDGGMFPLAVLYQHTSSCIS